MHPLQNCLPVSCRKISLPRPDQRDCCCEPSKHQTASTKSAALPKVSTIGVYHRCLPKAPTKGVYQKCCTTIKLKDIGNGLSLSLSTLYSQNVDEQPSLQKCLMWNAHERRSEKYHQSTRMLTNFKTVCGVPGADIHSLATCFHVIVGRPPICKIIHRHNYNPLYRRRLAPLFHALSETTSRALSKPSSAIYG